MEIVNSDNLTDLIKPYLEEIDFTPTEDTPWYLRGPKAIVVDSYELSDVDLSTDSCMDPFSLGSYPEPFAEHKMSLSELEERGNASYWQIRKIMKLLKAGDETTTIVSLAWLLNYNLSDTPIQSAIKHTGGFDIFLNLINVGSSKCRKGSLEALRRLCKAPATGRYLIELGIFDELLKTFSFTEIDLMLLALKIYKTLAHHKKSRTIIRKNGTLPCLVYLLSIADIKVILKGVKRKDPKVTVVRLTLQTITLVAHSVAIRHEICKLGIIQFLEPFLKAKIETIRSDALKLIMLISSIPKYRKMFEATNLIEKVLKCWTTEMKGEVVLRIIAKFSSSREGRRQIIKCNAVPDLIRQLTDQKVKGPNVIKYSVEALYRLGIEPSVREQIKALNMLPKLFEMVMHPSELIAQNVAGIIAFLSTYPDNWPKIYELGGVKTLVSIISTRREPKYLANVVKVIGDVAFDEKCMSQLAEMDTMSLLWTLLKSSSDRVKSATAETIVSFLKFYPDSPEQVRNLSGALEALMACLDSTNENVKASACRALSSVAKDRENLAIMTEMGLLEKVTYMVDEKAVSDTLKISFTILTCGMAEDPRNNFELGKRGVVAHMVSYLYSPNKDLQLSAAKTLWKLSRDPFNCISIYTSGATRMLTELMHSDDPRLVQAAGGCIFNIRTLAHDTEALLTLGESTSGNRNFTYRETPERFSPSFYFDSDIEP